MTASNQLVFGHHTTWNQHEFVEQPQIRAELTRLIESIGTSTQFSPSTRRVYLSRLRQFEQFVLRRGCSNLPQAFTEFLAEMRDSATACTINNYICMFRKLYGSSGQLSLIPRESNSIWFDASLNYIATGPAARLVLNEEAMARYIDSARNVSSRDLVLAYLFLTTSIRLGESVKIKIEDLVINDEKVTGIVIKQRLGHSVEAVGSELSAALTQWLNERSQMPASKRSPFLFPSRTCDKSIHTSAIDNRLRMVGWKAKMVVSASMLRATYLARSGALLP